MSRLRMFVVVAALTAGISAALAQDVYPSRPVTLMQGFAAGGNADVIARTLAEPLRVQLGVPVIVEARAGAGGNIASGYVAKSPPDGHTLILLTGGHAVSAALYKALPFDPVNDFQMLSTVGYLAFVIAVRADSPIRSLSDLIETARSNPGKLSYSSVGVGSTQHLAGELLGSMARIKMTHIPYRGGGAPMTDLLGGQIDVLVDSITVAGPHIASGTVRALAVTSGSRWWSHPEIPAVAETVPGYDVRTWIGVAAPKGLPPGVTERLNRAIGASLDVQSTADNLRKIGMDVRASSPEEMRALVATQIQRWREIVVEAGLPQQ